MDNNNINEQPIGIVISTPPVCTSYTEGARFNPSGMKVEYVYPSGKRAPVQSYTHTPDGALVGSNTFVEIRAGGFTARQRISVSPKFDGVNTQDICCIMAPYYGLSYCPNHPEKSMPIDAIKIKTPPDKTTYFEGEFFDPTGMEVVGRLQGRTEYNVNITSYDVSPKGALKSEQNCVRVVFKMLSAYLYLTVVPRLNAQSVPAVESLGLANGVDGQLHLASGELRPTFTDVQIDSGALPFAIKHVYVNGGGDKNCGSGWRLNLHSTLKRANASTEQLNINDLGKDEVDFVYTDGTGKNHVFDEVFYYVDSNGNKQPVERENVSVDADGKLIYEVNGRNYEVIREFKTVTGLLLSTRLENIKGAHLLEQRYEVDARLQKEILQCQNNIIDLEYQIDSFKLYDEVAVEPSDALSEQLSADAEVAITHCINYSKNIEDCMLKLQSELDKLNEKLLKGIKLNDEENYDMENENNIKARKWGIEGYLSELNMHLARSANNLQQGRRKSLYNILVSNLEEYKKMLQQKITELTKYELQLPVAFLSYEDGVSMCFNKFGELCGIVDGYDNHILIIWDRIKFNHIYIRAITSVLSGEREIKFDYTRSGNLSQITNFDGSTVKYSYGGSGLSAVEYSSGKRYDFTYNSCDEMTKISASHTGEYANISYSKGKAVNIEKYSKFYSINDNTTSSSANSTQIEKVSIRYNDGETTLESDGKTNTFYLDRFGALAASYEKDEKGYTARPRYEHTSKTDKLEYAVQEIDDELWHNDALVNPSQTPIAVITPSMLKGDVSYVFGGEANKTTVEEFDGYSPKSVLPFGTLASSAVGNKFRLRAVVYYGNGSKEYYASFDASNDREQYVALPVQLERSKLSSLQRIELYAECDSQNVVFDNLRFAPAAWECRQKDDFGNVITVKTSENRISDGVYEYSQTSSEYDSKHKHVVKRSKTTYTVGAVNSSVCEIEKYEYCEHGNLVKTTSYIAGEENAKGKTVTERVCDENGNIVKEFTYNTLDSSTKFYKESEYAEDGTVTAEIDESGENRTEIEYTDDGKVRVKTLPNGSKLAYGYDEEGNVTSMTQSTDDGEANSTEIKYTYGSPTRLTSGNNTVYYEYDSKRRMTKATVNGRATSVSYADNVSAPSATVDGVSFAPVKADKTVASFDGSTVENFKDKRGNAVMTKINGQLVRAGKYDLDGKTLASGDNVTNSVTQYMYDDVGKAVTQIDVSAGNNVEALTENYFYSQIGQITGRAINGAVQQTYAYFYKNNKTKDLDRVTLPNALNYYPQTDVNGRSTGKILKDSNNNDVYGEYVYYRKVGDHGTNMPSSIYYGKKKNGRYAIRDNIKYKYDEIGNIQEVKENGTLTVKYTYDKLGRIIREDNRTLGKTMLWSYDNFGNILTKRGTNFTFKPTDEIEVFTDEKLYTYDGDRLLSYGDEIMLYSDGEGNDKTNPCIYRGKVAEWNYGRQLKKLGDTVFTYDGYGRRLTKNNTVFTYDGNGKLIKQTDGTNTLEFVFDDSGVCGVTHNGTEYIFGKDIQGNIISVLDITGREVVHYAYDAWGNCKTTVLDEAHAEIAALNPFRYRGYYCDAETNLYYLNTRYYDPETGRFVSQDDVSYLDPEHVNGLNLFAYCGNNPVMNVDPSGEYFFSCLIIGIIAGAIIGAVCGGVAAYKTAKAAGATGWELFGWTMLGIFGGAIVGAAIGALVGAAVGGFIAGLSAIGGFIGGGGSLALAGGGILAGGAAVGSVSVGTAVAIGVGIGVIGSVVLLVKWIPGSWPGDDPTKSPGDGFIWRGPGEVGSEFGEWYNPATGDQLHPNLKHLPPKKPHWGWRNKLRRIFQDIFRGKL